MREDMESLALKKINILKLIQEYDKQANVIVEKMDKNNIIYNSEDLDIKVKLKCLKIHSMKICWYYNKGFCKKRGNCIYRHESEDCKTHLERGTCEARTCTSRHRKYCKYWKQGICRRADECAYLHRDCFNKSKVVDDTKVLQVDVKKNMSETNEADNYIGHRKIYKDNMEVLESEITTLKERNYNLLKKVKEILRERLELESENDNLKQRLGEDIIDEESESD